ncbi:MAG: 3-deoxy-D-manno-octulosonic acid transferase [Aestuariivita sp.]|nr:3-deoxy-D-manno-octulosonic acid transferase [Aestuariivita sp.]MCY4202944.1 3-deoxy-D-manno-octulosonic acid transferase [Aestuariivita sp.]MCY4287328.1 3-deoxy-D-manno-octulosonic acid transferase [Aestuariivita sp.]MCY4346006.1 3-deoxy-D-manno-octulosonic acid transferase [Aestuariivita sp.]
MSGVPQSPTTPYRVYQAVTTVLRPIIWTTVSAKLRKHGVPAARIAERLGHASIERPEGPLAWFHCASLGESLSVLALIDALLSRRPGLNALITSGTASSAGVLADRMPSACTHQFAPIDVREPVTRFLNHWRPNIGVFVESEIWPNLLVMARDQGSRLALINARLSARSVRGWRRFPATSAYLLNKFDLILAQNRSTANDLLAMNAPNDRLRNGRDLKSAARPLPVDQIELQRLRVAIGDRPIWIASSTHEGEEEIILSAHRTLLKHCPSACLILVPRHPERGDEIAALISENEFLTVRRSLSKRLSAETQVYLADSLGEMGLWYTLGSIVFVGGSFPKEVGGHNPYEPATFGNAVLTGPHRSNFREPYFALIEAGGVREVCDGKALSDMLIKLVTEPRMAGEIGQKALDFTQLGQGALEETLADVLSVLDPSLNA